MIKNSTELLNACKEALNKMLARCTKKGTQPSFYEMYQKGYADGWGDTMDCIPNDLRTIDQWHYIEIEDVPDNDDKHWLMFEFDGKYRDVTFGYYENGRWYLDYYPSGCQYEVIAWHPLPECIYK